MPEKCRVGVCGFDPMLVKGYVKTGERGLWWHMSDELYEELGVKPGTPVSGKILAIYDCEAKKVASPNDAFDWKTSKESGLVVLLPPGDHQVQVDGVPFPGTPRGKDRRQEVYAGQEKMSMKWWRGENEAQYKVGYIE
jgi:hypothetical protein